MNQIMILLYGSSQCVYSSISCDLYSNLFILLFWHIPKIHNPFVVSMLFGYSSVLKFIYSSRFFFSLTDFSCVSFRENPYENLLLREMNLFVLFSPFLIRCIHCIRYLTIIFWWIETKIPIWFRIFHICYIVASLDGFSSIKINEKPNWNMGMRLFSFLLNRIHLDYNWLDHF